MSMVRRHGHQEARIIWSRWVSVWSSPGASAGVGADLCRGLGGAEDRLPTWQHVFADQRAQDARELMVRLLRERAAFEVQPVR